MTLAADIANRALDAAGSSLTLGDLEDGNHDAQVVLRAYAPCLQQLLRAAHWDFARQQTPLQLLADATGQTANAGSLVPTPWTYEYAYPIDCLKARFVPRNYLAPGNTVPGNIALPATPLTTGTVTPQLPSRIVPARFTIATDGNYPAVTQAPSWDQQVEWWEVQGISPANRTVILTNVESASLVYTALVPYPNLWDALFQEAMVALLAARIALPLAEDKKLGLTLRQQNLVIAKAAVEQARVTNGNETWTNTDSIPDYIRVRSSGAGRAYNGSMDAEAGVLGYGWDAMAFDGNSSAF